MTVLFFSTSVLAQDDRTEEEEAEIKEAEDNAIEIEGQDYTPSFDVLIEGVDMNKKNEIPLKESFIPKIKDSMKKLPF